MHFTASNDNQPRQLAALNVDKKGLNPYQPKPRRTCFFSLQFSPVLPNCGGCFYHCDTSFLFVSTTLVIHSSHTAVLLCACASVCAACTPAGTLRVKGKWEVPHFLLFSDFGLTDLLTCIWVIGLRRAITPWQQPASWQTGPDLTERGEKKTGWEKKEKAGWTTVRIFGKMFQLCHKDRQLKELKPF